MCDTEGFPTWWNSKKLASVSSHVSFTLHRQLAHQTLFLSSVQTWPLIISSLPSPSLAMQLNQTVQIRLHSFLSSSQLRCKLQFFFFTFCNYHLHPSEFTNFKAGCYWMYLLILWGCWKYCSSIELFFSLQLLNYIDGVEKRKKGRELHLVQLVRRKMAFSYLKSF